MSYNDLGRLQKVDLREVWTSESGDFTPWLAREENIALLGDTIGIELEVEAQEKDVGPFRADILCKDTATNNWLLIENQLERTDHCHLGQLLTYAAGLKAVTIVWVAERFTEEHRAAMDWLNNITADDFLFFGLEIELWRIGNSPVAPKFNIVCQPNDWSKTVSGATRATGGLTDTQRLQLEFWTEFHRVLESRNSYIRGTKPRPQNWNNFSIGRSEFGLVTFVNTREHRIGVGLACWGLQAKPHFYLLQQRKAEIERELGEALDWRELPHRKESQIYIKSHDTDPAQRDRWPEQHGWMAERLERFHRVFAPLIKDLDADELQPSEHVEPGSEPVDSAAPPVAIRSDQMV